MMQDDAPTSPHPEQQTLASLSDCARKFLGQDVRAVNIMEQLGEEGQNDDIQRLTLRLMENALPLANMNTPSAVNSRVPHFGQVDHFAGSH